MVKPKKKVDYDNIVVSAKETMQKQVSGAPKSESKEVPAEVKEEPKPATVEPVAEEPPKAKQPKKVSDKDKPGSQRGLPDGWTRFTVTVPIEMAEDLKDLAYTERLKLKDVVVRAFEEALKGKDLIRRPDRKD